jgi:hypothetical protein
MSTLADPERNPVAINVAFDNHQISVELADGRIISVPLEWFPSLRGATVAQRANWRFIGGGVGIHWEDLDEDVSVVGLLGG